VRGEYDSGLRGFVLCHDAVSQGRGGVLLPGHVLERVADVHEDGVDVEKDLLLISPRDYVLQGSHEGQATPVPLDATVARASTTTPP